MFTRRIKHVTNQKKEMVETPEEAPENYTLATRVRHDGGIYEKGTVMNVKEHGKEVYEALKVYAKKE